MGSIQTIVSQISTELTNVASALERQTVDLMHSLDNAKNVSAKSQASLAHAEQLELNKGTVVETTEKVFEIAHQLEDLINRS